MLGARGTERHRIRAGIMFLTFGIILLVWAWGSWIYRTSVAGAGVAGAGVAGGEPATLPLDPDAASGDDGPPAPGAVGVVKTLPTFLGLGFLLVVAFLVGSFVIVRTLRKYREDLERKPPPPTESEDVWAMHRVPEPGEAYAEDDDEDEALTA